MIRAVDLTFSYSGATRRAIDGLSFEVLEGEIFGFLGPSGAGKSTTQRILTGLLRDYGGSAEVLGHDPRRAGSDYYERIGVSFELPNHYLKLTGRENLTYFASLYRGPTRAADELLAELGLGDAADLRVAQYSKGMQQRLTLARALLMEPRLLFLDEPTAGLDPASARRVRHLIAEQRAAGRTVFLTTHDMAVADELCDRVAFIVDGRIATVGAPRELKLSHGRPSLTVEFRENGTVRRREFALDRLGDNTEFLDLLRRHPVETLHTQEATLEDVFLRVTGRELAP